MSAVAPAIEISGLTKGYGKKQALRGVELSVRTGEVVALLGPNGAGKSTLLRIIASLISPDGGSVRVGGHDVTTEPLQARAALGLMLGEERSLYWRISGRRNLEFFAAMQGIEREPARVRIAELLERFGLTDVAEQRCGEYSTGMRARLGLARALIARPPVLLLDEPARSLDPLAAADLRGLLAQLAAEHNTAVLYATHDLHDAAEVADRIVGLSRGLIAFEHGSGISAVDLERALLELP